MKLKTYYLGVDYHKKYSQIAVMDRDGNIILNEKFPNEAEIIDSLVKRFPNTKLKAVVEACRNWGLIYDLLEDAGIETVLAHPTKVKAIAEAKIKTDSIDAGTLGRGLGRCRGGKEEDGGDDQGRVSACHGVSPLSRGSGR